MSNKVETIYVGYNKVAVYDGEGIPEIAIPPGWPDKNTFIDRSPVFSLTPQEIEERYKISFPIYWKDIQDNYSEQYQHNLYSVLNHINIRDGFYDSKIQIKYDKIENLVKKGIKFYFIIRTMTDDWYRESPTALESQILDAIKLGLCKVLFIFPTEGYMNTVHHVRWLSEFARLNKLDSNNFIFSHSNLKFQDTLDLAQSKGIEIKFKFLPINYFEYNLWFLNGSSPCYQEDNKRYKEKLDEYLKDNRHKNFDKYFNILNRMPRLHRIVLFTGVMSNSKLIEKTEISLGTEGIYPNPRIIKILEQISKSYPEYVNSYNFSKTHDFSIPTELDVDLNINRAPEFTREFYKTSFMSIITETLIEDNILFFSEKIFKPIYNLHPFILLGNPFSLQKLREFGYRTFDRWWDESYDLETDYLKRISKILKVMETISEWSKDKCIAVTQEMEEVLVHNFYNLLDNKRYENYMVELFKYQNNPKE